MKRRSFLLAALALPVVTMATKAAWPARSWIDDLPPWGRVVIDGHYCTGEHAYHVHDGHIASVNGVYQNGVPVPFTADGSGFVRLTPVRLGYARA